MKQNIKFIFNIYSRGKTYSYHRYPMLFAQFSVDNSTCLTQTQKIDLMDCFTFTFDTKNIMVDFNEWYLKIFVKTLVSTNRAINPWNTYSSDSSMFHMNCKIMWRYTLKIKQLVSQYFSHATHSSYNPFYKTTNKTQQQSLVTLKKSFLHKTFKSYIFVQ